MKLTVVVENFAVSGELMGEYGLSFHMTDGERNVLMDTGQGRSILYNSQVLGIDLPKVDTLLLSHGHYDHVGGFSEVIIQNSQMKVWGHEGICASHMSVRNGKPVFAGCHINKEFVDLNPVRGLTKITDKVWGVEIPVETRDPEFWDRPENLVVPSDDGWELDPFHDDLGFVVEGEKGLSVILGCSHSGVLNILETVKNHFNTDHFYAVTGGMHTRAFKADKLEKLTGELVSRFRVEKWRPCHCSGFGAAAALAARHPDVDWAGAGVKLEL